MLNVKQQSRFIVEPKLINPNADDQAKRLMTYLCDIYGTRILTGQQIGVVSTPELEILHEVTGKYPAVYGFDFMNYSPSRTERGATCSDTDIAIDWWQSGGIVTFCWHWNAPKDLIDLPPDRTWGSGFYTKATTFDVQKAMNDKESEDYKLLIRDIDAISSELKRLQDAGVPVLWRPLHEASGGWFWWGSKGAEPCVQLWKLMYDRMTNVHKLNHLIWVWNGQHADWYPGDEYVDIIGEDIYPPEQNYESQLDRFEKALAYTSMNKIIALSENGPIPDPDLMLQDRALWAWNCTWYGNFVYNTVDGHRVYAEKFTDREQLIKFYNHPFSLTKDELPDLNNYQLRE
ncbi:beta-mannosidase [Paenibacillus sp. FSL A5-0031]|uniref:glycosyl hydrolase n=1 Tax=Paenibacillus sp. FSL A5-0031 TaxID=1920420 RepID=UPI00096F8548|nr:glycosyl hydrolase [Paenibacillus sp. FSL A5-0031]OME86597.1 beta-mannosidase [Paenibacillus sp. FSL A5-0031]